MLVAVCFSGHVGAIAPTTPATFRNASSVPQSAEFSARSLSPKWQSEVSVRILRPNSQAGAMAAIAATIVVTASRLDG